MGKETTKDELYHDLRLKYGEYGEELIKLYQEKQRLLDQAVEVGGMEGDNIFKQANLVEHRISGLLISLNEGFGIKNK